MESRIKEECKICGNNKMIIFQHTSKCKKCGVLMYYPYVDDSHLTIDDDKRTGEKHKKLWNEWYRRASRLNHLNFTEMFFFTIENPETIFNDHIRILDYGGGGGQFAYVFKSILPKSDVFIVDIDNHALLKEYQSLNKQIKWNDFQKDTTTFNYIFLNDVYEHVNNPEQTLKILLPKLSDGGKLFIDTPRQFWLYPFLKNINKALYKKLLKGTVTTGHLQIWSKKSFIHVIDKAGFKIHKYAELSEFTREPDYYLKNMGVTNKLIISIGRLFYKNAKYIAKNKIMCALVKK